MFFSTKVWPLVISDTRILTAATQTTYTRPTVSPLGARISASSGGTTYVKTTSGSIITVVPKSLATLGGKIISSNIVSGQSAPHLGCVLNWSRSLWSDTLLSSANRHNNKDHHHPCDLQTQCHRGSENHRKGSDHSGAAWKERCHHTVKCRGQSATRWCLQWINWPWSSFELCVIFQGEKGLQAVQGTKPAIITASRPITKMIVTQPKGMTSGSQSTATKIIPTKIVYGQQGKTQVKLLMISKHLHVLPNRSFCSWNVRSGLQVQVTRCRPC